MCATYTSDFMNSLVQPLHYLRVSCPTCAIQNKSGFTWVSGHDDAYKIWEFQWSKHVENDDAPSDFGRPNFSAHCKKAFFFFFGALTCFEPVLASFPRDPQRISAFKQPATENLARCPSSRRCNLPPPSTEHWITFHRQAGVISPATSGKIINVHKLSGLWQ